MTEFPCIIANEKHNKLYYIFVNICKCFLENEMILNINAKQTEIVHCCILRFSHILFQQFRSCDCKY